MARIRIATEAELRRVLALDADAVACVEDAFRALAAGGVVMPPILRLDIESARGEVDVKTAYVPGVESFAVKISPGFFDNPKLGLPSVNGLMTLFSAKTGLLEAVLLDNGYLTDVRTAAAGAVAAKHLAREDAARVTILGAGVQARLQLEALALVRPLVAATFWARDPETAKAAAKEMTERLGIPCAATVDPAEACRDADVIVTTTPAHRPILMAGWLRSGQHVTAMGSDAEHKNEVEPAALALALYVADSLAQTRRLGELHHALEAGAVEDSGLLQLGEVVAGAKPGRTSPDQITLADLTGTGAQDTAIATLAMARLLAADAGAVFDA